MIKREASRLVEMVKTEKNHVEDCLQIYQDVYADYGMDDISNDFINVASYLEQIRLKLQFAMVKEGE